MGSMKYGIKQRIRRTKRAVLFGLKASFKGIDNKERLVSVMYE